MSEDDHPDPSSVGEEYAGTEEASSSGKLRIKKKKPGSSKSRDDGSRSVASSHDGLQGEKGKKQSSSRPPRRKPSDGVPDDLMGGSTTSSKPGGSTPTGSGTRRKSVENKADNLTMLSKGPGRKSNNDDNESAATGSSGGNSQRKSSRRMSPACSRSSDDGNGSLKKKTSVGGHQRTGSSRMDASSPSLEHDNKRSGMDESNWEVPSFAADSGKDTGVASSTFGSTLGGSGAFTADFNDATFADDNNAFFGSINFGKGGKQSAFSDAKDAAGAFGFQGSFGGQASFASTPVFGAPQREALDKTPLKDPPTRALGKVELLKKTVFSQNFACQPVTNPLNGNIIFCTSRDGEMFIQEVDPKRNFVQVLSSPILTPELHRKVITKYSRSAYGIDNVLKLCVGIHRSHGQPRVRVVTAIDLLILDSKHILRAIAVWQWGYGTNHPVSLQFLLSPPSGTDYAYDPESLLAADNCVFIAGQSTKGPCVFMCKPSVRESWSANFLSPSGKVMTMAVNSNRKRNYPYLAVGMADGSVSVWTYAAALKQVASKKNEPFRRLLYPLCRLEALWVLNSLQPTNFNEDKKQRGDDPKDAGMCISLEWLPPQPSFSSLLMLAASFQGGFAIFHVELPHMADPSEKNKFDPIPAPSQSTQLNATPQVKPFAAIRYPVNYPDTFISWIDLGPHVNPCLALLLHGRSTDDEPGRVVLGAINISQYRKGAKPKEALASFRMLATIAWRSKAKGFPLGFLPCNSLNAIMCHFGEGIITLSPSTRDFSPDPVVLSLKHPVFSNPPGLSSSGEVIGSDTISDKEGILHVFSANQCDLVKNDLEPNLLNWTRPARRYWLCRTVCGDCNETRTEESKEVFQFGDDDDLAVGGSSSDVICELEGEELTGLVPFRIVRCQGGDACSVLFRPALGQAQGSLSGFSLDCVSAALIDTKSSGVPDVEVIECRDVAFLPTSADGVRALALSRNGCSVSLLEYDAGTWKKGNSCRPILGIECDENYVESLRLFVASTSNSKCGLIVVGKKHSSNKSCILCGPFGTHEQVAAERWTKLLPEMSSQASQPCFWLEENEEVLSLICLPYSEGVQQKIALSTSSRVLLLSLELSLLAQTTTQVSCGALSPMGASTVSFCSSDSKIRYLCCLKGKFSTGTLATLRLPNFGYCSNLLLAVRSDRFLYTALHSSGNLIGYKENADCFMLPTAFTKPAILLEPLVANAVTEIRRPGASTPLLRAVIEKFGRKVASITHGDEEGIGNRGAGITPRVYEILYKFGLKQAASWLLTGGVHFERQTNTKILPPWMPLSAKKEAALNSDAFLHLVSNGDQYLSEYIQSPDHNMPSSLPRTADATPYSCREFSQEALAEGNAADVLKMLDMVGTESSDSMLLQLSLLLEIKSGDTTELLKTLSGYDQAGGSNATGLPNANKSLAALSVSLKLNELPGGKMSDDNINRWMKPLAPSLQRGTTFRRVRQRLLGESALDKAAGKGAQPKPDPLWQTPCNESRHLWNEGPNKEKENLLLLDKVEDWLGRRRPTLLGKAGVAAAEERGEGALANILDMDKEEDSLGDKSEDEIGIKGWVEGVGEGRLDDENLVAYFRFSEGEDEESPWRTEGFSDLSRFENKATIVGQGKGCTLQPTTSSCDEGEQGKVKILYDLVFEEAADQEPSGLAMAANRGGSLDVGVLHSREHSSRQRSTVEFWYYIPKASMVSNAIVLARRTIGEDADDFSKACVASDKRSMLWEVVLLKSGELEFRTCAGGVISSKQDQDDEEDHVTADGTEKKGVAKFEGWNHLCLILSSRDADNISFCSVSMFMMGTSVGSADVSVLPQGLDKESLKDDAQLGKFMQKSHLVFGLDHSASFRLTEIRVWACERSEDDIKMMMRESLDAAEARKKKFRVKIGKNKQKAGGGAGLLAPPKPGLAPKGLAPPKGGGVRAGRSGLLSPPKAGLLGSPKDRREISANSEEGQKESAFNPGDKEAGEPAIEATVFDTAFGNFDSSEKQVSKSGVDFPSTGNVDFGGSGDSGAFQGNDDGNPVANDDGALAQNTAETQRQSLWDGAVPLSQQVRSSAAAALIRGPPATRHFGGNRGGLPDLRGTDRYGVGGIAICGSEKTIVWRDEEDPPALTYPIGASGAIVSDQVDDEEGSEFLCCFLAKDRRMVVFELNSRTVVVELQMTTKLNFWRFLPPEAGEMTLCFMLITPVGGFHWMPLDDSPRPRQVWKRGSDLQGKKIVSYEEGGSNGMTAGDMISKAGLICVTDSNGTGTLEAWLVPICGDSGAVLASPDVQGAAFCLPENIEGGPFSPHLVLVLKIQEQMILTIKAITEPTTGSIGLDKELTTTVLPLEDFDKVNLEAPTLAMGHFPDVIVCSLGNIICCLVRSKGALFAYELHGSELKKIAQEQIGHYVVDAVMRYSAIEGGAEIVMLLSDNENQKDGRISSYYFRASV